MRGLDICHCHLPSVLSSDVTRETGGGYRDRSDARCELNLSVTLCLTVCACEFVLVWVGFLSHIMDLKEGCMMNLSVLVCEKCKGKKNHGVRVCKHVGVCKLTVHDGVDCELLKSCCGSVPVKLM